MGQAGDVNKGLAGGSYDNEHNELQTGGDTWPCEPGSVTGQFMASIPTVTAAKRSSETPITDLAGGNSGSSR